MLKIGLERGAMAALIAVSVSLASGCSWVRDMTGWGDDKDSAKSGTFPNLASVPNKPPDAGTTRQRLEVEEGLLADRANARHVAGPVATEERTASAEPGAAARPVVIDPRAPRPATPGPGANQPEGGLGPGGGVGLIAFARGSTALPEGSGRMIVRAANLQRRFGGTIVIVGHSARAEGDEATRRANAQARANAIVNGLINLGVDRAQIRAGAGDGRVDASRVDITLAGARTATRR
jgi:outer membrane protein OmpA-like peptidoglycan-associated protein